MTVETIPVPAHILLAHRITKLRAAVARYTADGVDATEARQELTRLETQASK